jgi:hypothetical protein
MGSKQLVLVFVAMLFFAGTASAQQAVSPAQVNTSSYYAGGSDCGHYDWQYGYQPVNSDPCTSSIYSNHGDVFASTFGACSAGSPVANFNTQVAGVLAPQGTQCTNVLYGSAVSTILKTWSNGQVIAIGGRSYVSVCSQDLSVCINSQVEAYCNGQTFQSTWGTAPACYQ